MIFLVLALVFMWLKEVTERRARQSADQFLGPALEALDWCGDYFVPMWNLEGKRHWFRWEMEYEYRIGFGEPVSVEVDLFGNICDAGNPTLRSWISLPEIERRKEQMKQVKSYEGNFYRK